jgi:cysteine desulfurase
VGRAAPPERADVTSRIYLDHAATTPVLPDVVDAMIPFLGGAGAYNPNSVHAEGRAARAALDDARAAIAKRLGVRPRELVFTGSGSEADNLAIFGAARARGGRGHLIVSAIEHNAVLHAMETLASEGWALTVLPVDETGHVDSEAFAQAIRPDTVLASVMLANNEIGSLQPIAQLAAIARSRGVLFHVDAVQAATCVAIDIPALGVDMLALASHKFYGPKGVGMLYVRAGVELVPLVVGGGQESALRAGTENVAGIVGFARAFERAQDDVADIGPRVAGLRDRLERELLARFPGARANGGEPRLPHIANVAFPDAEPGAMIVALDLAGVAVSSGSACAAGSTDPSHVLEAIGAPGWTRGRSVRFSLGRLTTERDIEDVLDRVGQILRVTA